MNYKDLLKEAVKDAEATKHYWPTNKYLVGEEGPKLFVPNKSTKR